MRLEGANVVVTGASSGIGRAAALELARRGANVVVAARREEALADVAGQCERLGVRAVAVPVDVTDEGSVGELARRAIGELGQVDIWVNNAAVSCFARFEECPSDDFRRVIETNLFGYVYGARAVLPHFRDRGRGVLINVSSVVGRVAQPFTSAYVATKWAIRGLGGALRQELRDAPSIHVCTLLPGSTDTPLFQHAANFSGREITPLKPIYDPEQVGRAIVRLAERPRRELVVGSAPKLLTALDRLAPGPVERWVGRQVELDHFGDGPVPHTAGNLYEPLPGLAVVSGGWKVGSRRKKLAALAGSAAVLPALALWASRR